MRVGGTGERTAAPGLSRVQAEGAVILPGDAAGIALPSGQVVTLIDVVMNAPGPEGLAARFRFLAPAIARDGGSVDFEQASTDMAWLCENYALSRVSAIGPVPGQIIISLSDRAVPFGEADPDATQFFEAYRHENGACIWEVF